VFSREASKKLRQEFWTSFGRSFPRKWILYDTKIKGLSLKFHFDKRKALVSLDIETVDLEKRIQLWEKLVALKSVIRSDFLPSAIFDDSYLLDNQKEISRMYVEKEGVSIHNKATWRETMLFFNASMKLLEAFYLEYKEVLNS
jgi:hypothetical protein